MRAPAGGAALAVIAARRAYISRMSLPKERVAVTCACESVEVQVAGAPIVCLACYCDSCQAGSRRIEALPNAGAVLDAFGGTAYVSYRKDRVAYVRGEELLRDVALDEMPATKRVVASCCNSAMMMRFDDMRHWMPIYRARFGSTAPPLEMRICTSMAPDPAAIPSGIPAHAVYSGGLMWKLLSSKIAMLLGR